MSQISISGSPLGTGLQNLLMADDIEPGSPVSYQTCKEIYLYHPLGAKMVDGPIRMAQSQARTISIPDSPESMVRNAFVNEWLALGVDKSIANLGRVSRVYGIGSIVMGIKGVDPTAALDPWKLSGQTIWFNVLDPLNTASNMMSGNQDPNLASFQRPGTVQVNGKSYHASRSCILMNEDPLFIAYSSSAFGYVGRSVYQRALFPLKTFVESMRTDDMITRKAGVLVVFLKAVGSGADKLMQAANSLKRMILREARTDNVINVGSDDKVESLNLQGIDTAAGYARKNALENTAVAADMPAKMLNSETFAAGFGEGTEDAKNVARYVDRVRIELAPVYAWFDNIVQYRAWTPEFYDTVKTANPEDYEGIDYKTAFVEWQNAFKAEWPSLLIEPDSDKVNVEDVKLKALVAITEVLLPLMDPENKVAVVQWLADNAGENKMLFPNPLILDWEALKSYVPPTPLAPDKEPGEPSEAEA